LFAAGGVGGQGGAVVEFEFPSGKRLRRMTVEGDAPLVADRTRSGDTLAWGGPTKVARFLNPAGGSTRHEFRKPTDWITVISFSPDGLLAAVGDRFGGLWLVETRSGKEFAALVGHAKGISGLAWRADGDRLFSGSDDGTVRVWNPHDRTESRRWVAHETGVTALQLDAVGRVVTAGRDRYTRRWTMEGVRVDQFGPVTDEVVELAVDGERIAVADWSGGVILFPGGKPIELPTQAVDPAPYPAPTTIAALAPIPERSPSPGFREMSVAASNPPGASALGGDSTAPSARNAGGNVGALARDAESMAERLRLEAIRNPADESLAKAYLQACELALTLRRGLARANELRTPRPE
jgi:hypothetical protein